MCECITIAKDMGNRMPVVEGSTAVIDRSNPDTSVIAWLYLSTLTPLVIPESSMNVDNILCIKDVMGE